jgi:tryptophan-rich sensory protein
MRVVAGTRARAIATAAASALTVALLGALTTDLGPWYTSLKEPSWKPPDLLFGPAWTLIFACAAAAGFIAWSRNPATHGRHDVVADRREREWMLAAFALNATLNLVWSLLFFRLHRPDWALVEVIALWLSIVLLIVMAGRRAAAAGWLLAPYLAWVSFAALLNQAVVRLNAPFGAT